MDEYHFQELLGKKVLILGGLGAEKTRLLARLLDEAIQAGFRRKVTLIDMAPRSLELDGMRIGARVEDFCRRTGEVRELIPRRVYAPRVEGRDRNETSRLAIYNARNLGSKLQEFISTPTKMLFINDITQYLHRGPLAVVRRSIAKCDTFVADGYRGKFPWDDFETGISRRERRITDRLTQGMDLVISL